MEEGNGRRQRKRFQGRRRRTECVVLQASALERPGEGDDALSVGDGVRDDLDSRLEQCPSLLVDQLSLGHGPVAIDDHCPWAIGHLRRIEADAYQHTKSAEPSEMAPTAFNSKSEELRCGAVRFRARNT